MIHTALSALILYDYIITFEDEVQLVWRHKSPLVNTVFYLHRYSTLLFGVVNGASGYFRGQEVSATSRFCYIFILIICQRCDMVNSRTGYDSDQLCYSCVAAATILGTTTSFLMLLSGREFCIIEAPPKPETSLVVCSALRVYVLWNRNIPLSLVTLLLNAVPVVVNVVRNQMTAAIVTLTEFTAVPVCVVEAPNHSNSICYMYNEYTILEPRAAAM